MVICVPKKNFLDVESALLDKISGLEGEIDNIKSVFKWVLYS